MRRSVRAAIVRGRAGWSWATAVAFATLAVVAIPGARSMAPARSAVAAEPAPTSAFVAIAPFRLADTRSRPCGCRELDEHTFEIDVDGHPRIPDGAVAVALTLTSVATGEPGYVTVYPSGHARPLAASLNSPPDHNVSNSAIVPLGADGSLRVYRKVPSDVVIDVSGAFVPAATATAGRYVTEPTRRIVDSRVGLGATSALGPRDEIRVGLPREVAADAVAVVVNVAGVGASAPGHLTVRPAGSRPVATAFMTVPGTGVAVSNAVVVPVSEDGFVLTASAGGHVVIDFLGWFTGPSAADSGLGLFVPVVPDRLHDTRERKPRIWPGGTIEVPVDLDGAAAVVTNVAVTRADRRTFVTAFPAGRRRPDTATINAARHDHTVANLAITQLGDRGIAYFARGGADVVVDLTGYFTGERTTSSRPVPANDPPRSRVLLVGDSTLRGLELEPSSQRAFVGFEPILDAASCRRLLRPSCRSGVTGTVPNTAVEAIAGTPGPLDIVVVKTGYNDWFSDFPREFDSVVRASRAKGAHTIVWFSYNELVRPLRENASRAYRENNADLRALTARPEYSDVLLADWLAYSNARQDWFWDGTHTTLAGSFAIADYASRWVAAVEHRPCPRSWVPGGTVPDPCPIPETIGPVGDPMSLYAVG